MCPNWLVNSAAGYPCWYPLLMRATKKMPRKITGAKWVRAIWLQYYRGICCTCKHHQLSRILGQHRHSRAEYRGRVLDFTQLEIDSGIHRSFVARVLVDTRTRVYNILREAVIQSVTSRTNGKCTVRRVNRQKKTRRSSDGQASRFNDSKVHSYTDNRGKKNPAAD